MGWDGVGWGGVGWGGVGWDGVGWVKFVWVRMIPGSIRICVPNLVAVRRSCRKGGGVQVRLATHTKTLR